MPDPAVAPLRTLPVYPSPPLKVGEKVRLLRDREFSKSELVAGSEHIVALVEPSHFPSKGHDSIDPTRDYSVMLHKNGTTVRGGKLTAWYPVSPFELERVEKQYHQSVAGDTNRDPNTIYVVQNHWNADHFHVMRGSYSFPEGVTQPVLRTVQQAVDFARSHGFEPVVPKFVRMMDRPKDETDSRPAWAKNYPDHWKATQSRWGRGWQPTPGERVKTREECRGADGRAHFPFGTIGIVEKYVEGDVLPAVVLNLPGSPVIYPWNVDPCPLNVDEEEIRALVRIRANRKPPFWLTPVLPRPRPVPQINVDMKLMERMNDIYSADKFDWSDKVEDRLPLGSKPIKSKPRGLITYEGVQYAITGGLYAPTYIKATAWRVIEATSQWASKVVRPSDLPIYEIGYHGIMATYKNKAYILVGPEVEFVADRVKEIVK